MLRLSKPKSKQKLWVDDTRKPPDNSWQWAKSAREAEAILSSNKIKEISLDYDLYLIEGDDKSKNYEAATGADVAAWAKRHDLLPSTVYIHSANPAGISEIKLALGSHPYICTPLEPNSDESMDHLSYREIFEEIISKPSVDIEWKSVEASWEKMSEVPFQDLYHIAPSADRARIQTHGLQPSVTTNSPRWDGSAFKDWFEDQPEGVYGWVTPQEAQRYMSMTSDETSEPMDIWRIPGNQIQEMQQDQIHPTARVIPHVVYPEMHRAYEQTSPKGNPDFWEPYSTLQNPFLEKEEAQKWQPYYPEWEVGQPTYAKAKWSIDIQNGPKKVYNWELDIDHKSHKVSDPPNYRKGTDGKHCSVCTMYDKGICWGYGNKKVEANYVCDSFELEKKTSNINKIAEEAKMRLEYLTTNAAWAVIWGDQIIPLDNIPGMGTKRLFQSQEEAIEALHRVGLGVNEDGSVSSLPQETPEHPDPWMDNEPGSTMFPEDWTRGSSQLYNWQEEKDFSYEKKTTSVHMADKTHYKPQDEIKKGPVKAKPNDDDKQSTPVHLLDTVIHNLEHVVRHVERFKDPKVQTDKGSIQFNYEHAIKHLEESVEHAEKLAEHLKKNDVDSDFFKDEAKELATTKETKSSQSLWTLVE